MLYIVVGLLCAGVGTRFGYWLKEKEIEDELVPSVEEQDIFEADLDKGSNDD